MTRLLSRNESMQANCGTKKEQPMAKEAISSQHDPAEFSPALSCSILLWWESVISAMCMVCIDDIG